MDAILETAIVPIAYNYAADNEENAAFVEAWTEEFGTIPGATNLPGATYGALYLVKTAYEAIEGDVTSEALYEQLQVADVHVPEGHLKFNEGVRLATKDIYVVKPVELDSGYNYEILKTYTDVGPNGLTVG